MYSNRLCVVILVLCCKAGADNDRVNESSQNASSKKIYTANDLIQQLTKLAIADNIPRLRFPSNDYEENGSENTSPQRIRPDFQSGQNQNYVRDSFPPTGNQNLGPQYTQFDQSPNQPPFPRPPRRKRPKKPKRPAGYYQQYPQDYASYPQEYPPQYPPQYPQGQQEYPYPQYPYADGYPQQDPYLQGGIPTGYPQQDPYLQGQFPNGAEGPFSSLTRALYSIAKYDDQQCVPRLLCEVAAGGNPSAKQASFIPSFLNMESLFTLLSAFTGDQVSPYLVFGRAALLGVTSQGSPSSCRYAYPECPRDPDRLVEYLNNHNGGFFRFFNGLQDPLNPDQNSDLAQPDASQFGVSQLAQLFGQFNRPTNQNQQGTYNQRPSQFYNSGGDGNIGQYPAEYQYGRTKLDSNRTNVEASEARIQNKPQVSSVYYGSNSINTPVSNNDLFISQSYHHFDFAGSQNNVQPNDAFKFPSEYSINNNINYIPDSPIDKNHLRFPSDGGVSYYGDSNRKQPKVLLFPGAADITQNQNLYYPKPLPFYDHSKMIFPDRTGTGNLKFDSSQLSHPNYRPDIYRAQRPTSSAQSGIRDNKYYSNNQYQSASTKKYVYIVRGNGDPNHPEIVEEKYLQRRSDNNDEATVPEYRSSERSGRAWKFPSS